MLVKILTVSAILGLTLGDKGVLSTTQLKVGFKVSANTAGAACKFCYMERLKIKCLDNAKACAADEKCRRYVINKCGLDDKRKTCAAKTFLDNYPKVTKRMVKKLDGAVRTLFECKCPVCKLTTAETSKLSELYKKVLTNLATKKKNEGKQKGSGNGDDKTRVEKLRSNPLYSAKGIKQYRSNLICCKKMTAKGGVKKIPLTQKTCESLSNSTVLPKKECEASLPKLTERLCALFGDKVCSSDGTVYANRCEARQANVTDATRDNCPKDSCNCEDRTRPICVKVNGTQVTMANPCQFKCLKSQPGNSKAMILAPGPCTKICETIKLVKRIPVCDTMTNTTYGSKIECQCEGACKTQGSFTMGRCPRATEKGCVCLRKKVTNKQPLCRTKTIGGKKIIQTIASKCLAMCSDAVDVDTTSGSTTVKDGSTIKAGVCARDQDNCDINSDSTVGNCSETRDIDNARQARLRLKFKLGLCFPDRLPRKLLWNGLRTAFRNFFLRQCSKFNITQDDDNDKVLIRKFEPLKKVKSALKGSCTKPDHKFNTVVAFLAKDLLKVRRLKQCIKAVNVTKVAKVIIMRLKEAFNAADPDASCVCSASEILSKVCGSATDNKKLLMACSRCTNCTAVAGSADSTIGVGNTITIESSASAGSSRRRLAETAGPITVEEVNENGEVVTDSSATGTTAQPGASTTGNNNGGGDGSAAMKLSSIIGVFAAIMVSLFF